MNDVSVNTDHTSLCDCMLSFLWIIYEGVLNCIFLFFLFPYIFLHVDIMWLRHVFKMQIHHRRTDTWFLQCPHPCKSIVSFFKVNWTSSYWEWWESSVGKPLVLQTQGHGFHPCNLHTKAWAWWPCTCLLSSEEVEAERALEHSGQAAWSRA